MDNQYALYALIDYDFQWFVERWSVVMNRHAHDVLQRVPD